MKKAFLFTFIALTSTFAHACLSGLQFDSASVAAVQPLNSKFDLVRLQVTGNSADNPECRFDSQDADRVGILAPAGQLHVGSKISGYINQQADGSYTLSYGNL